MNHWNSQRYLQEGRKLGIAENVLANAVAVAEHIKACNPHTPVLFTLRHIAQECEVPYGFLRGVINRSLIEESYRVFKLKKSGVGHAKDRFRYVCVPHPLLMRVQRWINSEILTHVPLHQCSFAYAKGSIPLEAAEIHINSKWLLKLDVTNFFESILEPKVYNIFTALGYQPLVAFELARLCTRLRNSGNPMQSKETHANFITAPYQDLRIGHLPQGAPTSPHIANITARPLDEAIWALAQARGLRYTRYADDITFSTAGDWTRTEALDTIHATYALLREHDLWPNRTKTHISPPGARKVVLGLLVDGSIPRLTSEFKDRVRTHVHFLTRQDIGPRIHAAARGFESVLGLQRHLYGLLAYAISIDRSWALSMLSELSRVDWPKFESAEFSA